jgi:hypothetical protein
MFKYLIPRLFHFFLFLIHYIFTKNPFQIHQFPSHILDFIVLAHNFKLLLFTYLLGLRIILFLNFLSFLIVTLFFQCFIYQKIYQIDSMIDLKHLQIYLFFIHFFYFLHTKVLKMHFIFLGLISLFQGCFEMFLFTLVFFTLS